jgi:hypothetical protein
MKAQEMPVFCQKRQKNINSNLTLQNACNPCNTGLSTVYRFLETPQNRDKSSNGKHLIPNSP